MTRLTKQSIDTEVSVNNSVVTREMAKDEDRNWQIGVEAKKFLEERGEVVPDAESVYAVFGIRAEGALRGVALVMDDTGEFRDNFESVTVQQVTVDGVRYEDQAARWLIAKIRRWATLHGFDRVNAVTESASDIDSVGRRSIRPRQTAGRTRAEKSGRFRRKITEGTHRTRFPFRVREFCRWGEYRNAVV